MPYRVIYSPAAEEHMRSLPARQRVTVLDAVEHRLMYQPALETRNRKPLRANPLAPWELRIGALRVYYDVREGPEPVVAIQAIGVKKRNQIFIAGKVIDL